MPDSEGRSAQNGNPEIMQLVQTMPGRRYVINSDILCHVFWDECH
jgi:hypothetical protein